VHQEVKQVQCYVHLQSVQGGQDKVRGDVRALHAFLNVRGRMGAEQVPEAKEEKVGRQEDSRAKL
jgi:hypothetical protein